MPSAERIGEYEILEKIGEGTFGAVYRCRRQVSGEIRAVKVCSVNDLDSISRFSREADVASSLEHRNIVRVFDFGISDLGPYLTQECLDGVDLSKKIADREPLGLMQRMGYLLQIAQAMVHAHSKGIIHRDLKPGNIRVLPDDQIKIMDFGIAQLAHSEERIAKVGGILGTAGYLSPEQVLGRATDERADIFSFGALAYHLLCYEAPFPGEDLSEVLRGVLKFEPQPVQIHWPECPPPLADVIARCLEKEPEDRYSSFEEILTELTSLMAGLHSVPAAGGKSSKGKPVAVRPAVAGPQTVPLTSGPNAWYRRAVRRGRILIEHPSSVRWAAAAVGAVAIAGSWWLAGGPSGGDSTLAQSAAVVASPPVESRQPVDGPHGSLLVSAAPWGEVVAVTTAQGFAVDLPAEAVTPLVLDLPAGRYRVELASPFSEDGRFCYVDVGPLRATSCSVQFIEVEATDYFKDAGWWR